MERTELSKLGKVAILKHLTKGVKCKHETSGLGFAEDAATVNTQPELNTLVSQKLFLEGIHFDLVYTPLKHLGYKLVVAAVSDIYAMNGEPRQLLLNVGVSSRFSLEDLEDLQAIEEAKGAPTEPAEVFFERVEAYRKAHGIN